MNGTSINKTKLLLSSRDGNTVFEPAAVETVQWTTHRSGVPGKLTFKVLYDKRLDFTEGGAVMLYKDNKPLFYGYVFKRSRDREGIIEVTAYDQLRYLNNKDVYVYHISKVWCYSGGFIIAKFFRIRKYQKPTNGDYSLVHWLCV